MLQAYAPPKWRQIRRVIPVKKLISLLFICICLAPVFCQAADTNYGYPVEDPYAATVLGTPPSQRPELPDKIKTKRLTISSLSEDSKPDVFYYDDGVRCTLAPQRGKAPLIFIIAGTGAGDQAANQTTLMKAFHKAGFHVVTLPSSTHPNFIISASKSHIPGDLTEDAADLYALMEHVWNKIKNDIQVSDFHLLGYSLGGTQAAFISKLDDEQNIFNFRKVLLLNPAVSLYDSIIHIEELLDGIPGGAGNIFRFTNKMLDRFTEFYIHGQYLGLNNDFLFEAYSAHVFSDNEAKGIIGASFRLSLAAMIFVSDVMTNGGYVTPKNRVLKSSDDFSDYFTISVHLSFFDYFDEYFLPHFLKKRPALTREALIASQSLRSIEAYLKSSPKIHVATNANDFILSPEDLRYLEGVFEERIKVYPYGGHLGNLGYGENLDYTTSIFSGKEDGQ